MKIELKVGSKLICNNDAGWLADDELDADGPGYKDEVVVRRIGAELEDCAWVPIVWLEGYPGESDYEAFYLDDFEVVADEG